MKRGWLARALCVFFVASLSTVVAPPASAQGGGTESVPTDSTSGEVPEPPATDDTPTEDRLKSDFEYPPDRLSNADWMRDRLRSLEAEIAALDTPDADSSTDRLRAQTRRETLREQLDDGIATPARFLLVRSLASADARLAILDAKSEARRTRLDQLRDEATLVKEHLDQLLERRAVDPEWLEQARKSEQAALDALEDARELERAEADEARRRLLAKKRKLAETALEETREHHEDLAKLRRETREKLEALSREKGALLEQIDALESEPSPATVDPIFEELIALRQRVHAQFRQALRKAEQAQEPVASARDAVDEASAELNEEKRRRDRFGAADIWELRVEASRMRLELAEQRLDRAMERLEARRERVRDYLPHLQFFPGQVRALLPHISDDTRSSFLDLGNPDRWESALQSLRNGLRATVLGIQQQWRNAMSTDLFTMDAWVWLWGVIWRLALAVVGIRLLLPLLPVVVGRITDAMMRFQFIRRHPTLTIKLAELSRALLAPLLYYLGVRFVAAYLTTSVPQVEALVWLIDAFFIYWFAVAVSRVIVVPRWQRRQQGHVSAEAFENIDEADASAIADLFVLEPERAAKLMRSVRVVVVFWLLTAYVPDVVRWVGGVNLIWWVVELVAVWGFVGLVYWVLSQWRDDIATGFSHLASERMSGAVDFVSRHKDRPWGVLVIALASVYVLLKEIAILVQRYLLSSEWVRRAQSFAFRKQIEMRDGGAPRKTGVDRLPADYAETCTAKAVPGDETYVERTEYIQRAAAQYDAWRDDPKARGSLIITGEPGVGVTTFVRGLEARFSDAGQHAIRSTRVSNDVRTSDDVLEMVAGLFDIEPVPETEAELIDELERVDSRVVILDDCHNTFTRQIEGFGALETLLDITNLCDEQHFFVLTFNLFAWNYVNRIYSREHYFGRSMELPAWSEDELRALIEARNQAAGYNVSFANLMPEESEAIDDAHFEVIKTANGYFRYLHEFCGGKPNVALEFWLRSLHQTADAHTLHVSLFRRPSMRELKSCSYDHWFLLSALVQHTDLNPHEASEIVNLPPGFCTLALDYFDEERVIEFEDDTGRARLTPLYLQQVIDHLTNSNFLYR